MAPTAIAVNDLLNTLEEEDLMSALSYIQFLSVNRKKAKAERSKVAMKEIQEMFADDKGWESEEEMLADMAEFRKKN